MRSLFSDTIQPTVHGSMTVFASTSSLLSHALRLDGELASRQMTSQWGGTLTFFTRSFSRSPQATAPAHCG